MKAVAKNLGGRPRKWQSATAAQKVVDDYFKAIKQEDRPPTLCGLSLALDLDKRSLMRYAAGPDDDGFVAVIKKAKTRIEQAHEERLFGSNSTGSIFWLKNHGGYRDQQELTHSGPDGGPIALAAVRAMTDEELAKKLAQLEGK